MGRALGIAATSARVRLPLIEHPQLAHVRGMIESVPTGRAIMDSITAHPVHLGVAKAADGKVGGFTLNAEWIPMQRLVSFSDALFDPSMARDLATTTVHEAVHVSQIPGPAHMLANSIVRPFRAAAEAAWEGGRAALRGENPLPAAARGSDRIWLRPEVKAFQAEHRFLAELDNATSRVHPTAQEVLADIAGPAGAYRDTAVRGRIISAATAAVTAGVAGNQIHSALEG